MLIPSLLLPALKLWLWPSVVTVSVTIFYMYWLRSVQGYFSEPLSLPPGRWRVPTAAVSAGAIVVVVMVVLVPVFDIIKLKAT